ncbi:MAG: collagen-like protein, partial [Bacteroidales bacterium]|nr:collagen-like protein [Bacteroidales bacterium]
MKRSLKFLSLLVMTGMVMASCEGPMGPAGDQGDKGD